jgi:hypothetical protein
VRYLYNHIKKVEEYMHLLYIALRLEAFAMALHLEAFAMALRLEAFAMALRLEAFAMTLRLQACLTNHIFGISRQTASCFYHLKVRTVLCRPRPARRKFIICSMLPKSF